MLITCDNAAFGYGDNLIFSNVSFTVNEGERVGLIGANGEGKTTLINLLLGRLEADEGAVLRKSGLKVGYLEQTGGYSSGNTVYSEMREIFKEEISAVEKLLTLSNELAQTQYRSREYDNLSAKIEGINKFLSARDCFDLDVKIKTVLNGMGFADKYDQVIDTMSGGEKTRLKLARLLLENPDLLILDEPTNHLDISTLYWLEDYLQTFKGAVFVVSHDRYFLDKVVGRILEIENKKLLSFAGNYSKYKVLKAGLYARQLKEYEAQQEERARLQDYVDRNLVRASTTKMAQSRRKQLEKMEILQKPLPPQAPPKFNFEYDVKPYEQVLEINNLNLRRGDRLLISDGNLSVKRGEKVAVVGENGAGKSTLIKEILNGNPAIKCGRFVKLALYDQESANLNPDNTVLAELWERHVGYTQTEARSALARCGLFADDMQKQIRQLSGGERAKLALCVLECERGNVLLLDEPTNHLDLPAREGLEEALKKFDGTLIFVSHDRYFISALADAVAEIEGGKLNYFAGGYEDYTARKKLAEQSAREQAEREKTEKKNAEKATSYRSKKERAEEERRKELVKKIEGEISACEREEEEINALLSDPATAVNYTLVNELVKKLETIKLQLDELYKQYEKVL